MTDAPKLKKTLSKYMTGTLTPPRVGSVQNMRERTESDEDYGKVVEDPELKRPLVKKTLSKFGISNEIVKKLSTTGLSGGDSDEEYGKVVADPELEPKLDGPIIRRSLSRYGSYQQKPVIENPRSDSDDEYGQLDAKFLEGEAIINNTTSDSKTSNASATSRNHHDQAKADGTWDNVTVESVPNDSDSKFSAQQPTSTMNIEDDPEYLILLQRGYKKEQATMIVKRQRSRGNLTSASVSSHDLSESSSMFSGTAPGTIASTVPSGRTHEKSKIRVESFWNFQHPEESDDTESKVSARSEATVVSSGAKSDVAHASNPVSNSAGTTSQLTLVQERSVQNLMVAGMSREEAIIYVCGPSANRKVGNSSGPNASPAKLGPLARLEAMGFRRTAVAGADTSAQSQQQQQQAAALPPLHPSASAGPAERRHFPPASSSSGPPDNSGTQLAEQLRRLNMATSVSVGSQPLRAQSSPLLLAQQQPQPHGYVQQPFATLNLPPQQLQDALQQQEHILGSIQANHVIEEGDDEDNDEDDVSEDEATTDARIQKMIAEQKAEFGVCMYDVLKMEDEAGMRRLISEGYRPEDAVRILFEQKGYVSSRPLPQPNRKGQKKAGSVQPPVPVPVPVPVPMPIVTQGNMHPHGFAIQPGYPAQSLSVQPAAPYMIPHQQPHQQPPYQVPQPIQLPPQQLPPQQHQQYSQVGAQKTTDGKEGEEESIYSVDDEESDDDEDDDNEELEEIPQGSKPELPQYAISPKGHDAAKARKKAGDDDTFGRVLKKKTLSKMKTFLGLPVGDHHLKHDKLGNKKSEQERSVQKRLRYKDSDVEAIIKMGFTKDQAVQALFANKNKVDLAVNALLTEGETRSTTSTTLRRTASMPPPPRPQYYQQTPGMMVAYPPNYVYAQQQPSQPQMMMVYPSAAPQPVYYSPAPQPAAYVVGTPQTMPVGYMQPPQPMVGYPQSNSASFHMPSTQHPPSPYANPPPPGTWR